MNKISIDFKCSELLKKKAIYILNLISSITSISFTISQNNPQIVYGEEYGSPRLYIPYIEYEAKDSEWQLFTGRSRLMLPGFIQPVSLEVNDNKLGIDFFSLAYHFLEMGLADSSQERWSPDLIDTRIRHVYPFFNSFVTLFVNTLRKSGCVHENFVISSPWPNQAPLAIGLSHDLDIFKRKFIGSLGILAKSVLTNEIPGGVGGSVKGLAHTMKSSVSAGDNPYYQFKKWFNLENRSTMFLFAGERKSANDPTYKIKDVAKELSKYDNSNFEIAYHNGIDTSDEIEHLEENKTQLEKHFNYEVQGIRPHYLDFKLPSFWTKIKSFSYSSSVGSDTIPGFTSGLNFPFYGFDFKSAQPFDILEIPIGLMDCALFDIKDHILRERTLNDILANCRDSHGLLVLDWHVRTAYDPDYPGWFDSYISILEKAKAQGAYIASLDEINRYWRKHCESVFLS